MRKFLAVATALCLLASPALAGPRQVVVQRDAGPLVCGLIFNWNSPDCSTGSVLFGSILWGAAIGTGVGAVAGTAAGVGGYAATHTTIEVIGAGAAIGAGTGFVLPIVLRR